MFRAALLLVLARGDEVALLQWARTEQEPLLSQRTGVPPWKPPPPLPPPHGQTIIINSSTIYGNVIGGSSGTAPLRSEFVGNTDRRISVSAGDTQWKHDVFMPIGNTKKIFTVSANGTDIRHRVNTDLWDRTTERLGRVANSGREGIDDLPDVVGALDEDPDAGESGLRDGQGDADDPEDAEDVEENTTTPEPVRVDGPPPRKPRLETSRQRDGLADRWHGEDPPRGDEVALLQWARTEKEPLLSQRTGVPPWKPPPPLPPPDGQTIIINSSTIYGNVIGGSSGTAPLQSEFLRNRDGRFGVSAGDTQWQHTVIMPIGNTRKEVTVSANGTDIHHRVRTDLFDRTTRRLGRVANSGREGIDDLPDVVGALDEDPDAGESGLRDGQGDADDPEDAEDVEENTTTPEPVRVDGPPARKPRLERSRVNKTSRQRDGLADRWHGEDVYAPDLNP